MRCHFRSAQGGGREAELKSSVCVCAKLCLPLLSHSSDTDPAQDMDRLHQIQLQPATLRKERHSCHPVQNVTEAAKDFQRWIISIAVALL